MNVPLWIVQTSGTPVSCFTVEEPRYQKLPRPVLAPVLGKTSGPVLEDLRGASLRRSTPGSYFGPGPFSVS